MSKFAVLATIILVVLAPLTVNAAPDNYFYVNSYDYASAWPSSSQTYDYANVQKAINDAADWATLNGKEAYVLLAVGGYRMGTAQPGAILTSLSLKDGVTIIGGFAGTETDTIPTYKQSYDPTGSTPTTSIWANDEMPVFINTGVGPTAGLQNVVVGYGSGHNEGRDCGGGMDNTNSSPTITNCTFLNNITNGNGGSMRNDNSSPTVTNCTFTFNTTQSQAVNGGGIYNTNGSSPTLKYCTFTNNIADGSGGGMYSDDSNPTLINCYFTGNKANGSGGGVNINSGSATLINCTFTNDTTATSGGGINVATGGSATLINCVAMGNKADTGGAMNIDSGTLINCTVLSNTANSCGGVCTYQTSSALINCLVALNNNSNFLSNNLNSAGTIKSSVIGNTPYNSTGTQQSTFSPSPAITDFNSDGSLTSAASYAIKQGDVTLYEGIVNPLLTTLNGLGELPLTAMDMLDINGLSVIDASSPSRIDIGAFRRPGTVTDVTVSPTTAMLRKGQTTTFAATVTAQDGAGQRVIWSVNSTAGSTIDSNGLLTIATGETATALTVTATSAEDKTKSGTATVTVLDIPPAVTTVTANAGYGGTVSNGGSGLTYTVTPNTGFVIDQVFVDGVEQTVSDRSTFTHTFDDDGGTHSIFATFGYKVNFNMPANGTLTVSSAGNLPSGTLVHGGQALSITVTPDNGYVLESLTVNGADVANYYNNGYPYTVGTSGAKRPLSDGTEVSAQGADIAATFAEQTYNVSIGTFTGGSVAADNANYKENDVVTLTITPDAGYELSAISAYKTGYQTATINLSGSGNTRTFAMPAYDVTVTATFQKTAYQIALEAAQSLILGVGYTVDQATANTEAAVKIWLANQINDIFSMSAINITVSAADITIANFNAAVAGTAGTPAGTNGSFSFTVSLSNGSSSLTTPSINGVITATAYTITGIDNVPQAKMLNAWTGNGQLHVSGLTIGKLWAVYDISGSMIYQNQATGEKADVNLAAQGVYVVVSGAERVKVAYTK